MDEFIERIVKFIFDEWDKLLPHQKEKTRDDLINTFISFVGEGVQKNKKNLSVHLN